MPYTGRPSEGCANCRQAKKKCDGGQPSCSLCRRRGKTCGGYRETTVFRPWTGPSGWKSSDNGETAQLRRQPSSTELIACQFFFDQLVTPTHYTFFQDIKPDDFLMKPIVACALAAMTNRRADSHNSNEARQYYLQAITATNAVLRNPEKVKGDNTLVAISLLSLFERISWEPCASKSFWKHHVEGSARVLELRGRRQIRTKTGASLFRAISRTIVNCALIWENEPPDFLLRWTQALDLEESLVPSDQLTVFAIRLASLRAGFSAGQTNDQELATLSESLEADLISWSESTLASGTVPSSPEAQPVNVANGCHGTRHEFGIPLAHSLWNRWRSLRIILSRTREAIWRRSWPVLDQTISPIPDLEQYRTLRQRMVTDICTTAAHAFDTDPSATLNSGAVAAGMQLIDPLCLAGTCLAEQLADIITSIDGNRVMLFNKPLHTDTTNDDSTQLAWIIDRVDYIANKIGIRWALAIGNFLRGGTDLCYDLDRSKIIEFHDPLMLLYQGQTLDFEDMAGLLSSEGSPRSAYGSS